MGSNQLDTQLEVTRGLEAFARKMEMSVVQAPTKVIFFFFLSGPFTQTAQSRKRTKTGKEREHETEMFLRQSEADLPLFSFYVFHLQCAILERFHETLSRAQ